MNENDIYTIWLTRVKGIGPAGQHKLLRTGLTSEQIYQAVINEDIELLQQKGITQKLTNLMRQSSSLQTARQILQECDNQQIRILSLENESLPERFAEFDNLPILLYAKGQDIPLKTGTGIIGARRCSQGGKNMAIMIATDMVIHGEYIISGMAKGVDSYAHTAVLRESDGIPIAVLGNGLDICYPKEHEKLYQSILMRGLAVSEYPPGTKPRPYHFPRRNRIIAALSDWIYIIEPGSKSGTQSTIEAAIEYGVHYDIMR